MYESFIAKHLCNLQPPSLRMRILRDEAFCEKNKLTPQPVITVASSWHINQRDFVSAVRDVLKNKKSQQFKCRDGLKIIIEINKDNVLLKTNANKKKSKNIILEELMILSPCPEKRKRAIDNLINRMGPTATDFSLLQTASLNRELSDDEAIELLTESAIGVESNKERLIHAFKINEVTLNHIVPDDWIYYKRFGGPVPTNANQAIYFQEILSKYRKELLQRNLSKGLEICLLGNLHDDLSPNQWTENFSNDDLWHALDACKPFQDPVSLLGSLDIAIYRQDDERFCKFADEAVIKLVQDTFPRGDGVDSYKLIPTLAELVLNRINTLDNGTFMTPFWKRMCAWMQSLLISRLTYSYSFDFESLNKWCRSQMTIAGHYVNLLDLRREPIYLATLMTPKAFREEIISRVALLRSRHEAQGKIVPRTDIIDKAVNEIKAKGFPWSCALPGPLEGHRRPVENNLHIINNTIANEIRNKFKDENNENLLSFLVHVSQWCELEEGILESIRNEINKITLSGIKEKDYLMRMRRIADIGLIAAAHRDTKLAMVIGDTVVNTAQEVKKSSQVFSIINALLIAGAAFENESEWAEWLEEMLRRVAIGVPQDEAVNAFLQNIEELKKIIKLNLGVYARAEAMALTAK